MPVAAYQAAQLEPAQHRLGGPFGSRAAFVGEAAQAAQEAALGRLAVAPEIAEDLGRLAAQPFAHLGVQLAAVAALGLRQALEEVVGRHLQEIGVAAGHLVEEDGVGGGEADRQAAQRAFEQLGHLDPFEGPTGNSAKMLKKGEPSTLRRMVSSRYWSSSSRLSRLAVTKATPAEAARLRKAPKKLSSRCGIFDRQLELVAEQHDPGAFAGERPQQAAHRGEARLAVRPHPAGFGQRLVDLEPQIARADLAEAEEIERDRQQRLGLVEERLVGPRVGQADQQRAFADPPLADQGAALAAVDHLGDLAEQLAAAEEMLRSGDRLAMEKGLRGLGLIVLCPAATRAGGRPAGRARPPPGWSPRRARFSSRWRWKSARRGPGERPFRPAR